jgi:hypothetical protein
MTTATNWLVGEVCKLAAELTDELERLPDGVVEVELRVSGYGPIPGAHGLCDYAEHIRRIRSNGGEWGGTERIKRERFA